MHRKGSRTVTIPLVPRAAGALDLAISEQLGGPIFLDASGDPLTGDVAARMARRVANTASTLKRIGPHSLQHFFITAPSMPAFPLRDVQEAVSHADPRTTMRDDGAWGSLDRHATYIVATFVAAASRGDTTHHR